MLRAVEAAAIPSESRAIEVHAHCRNVGLLLYGQIDQPFDPLDGGLDLPAQIAEVLKVFAENLDGEVSCAAFASASRRCGTAPADESRSIRARSSCARRPPTRGCTVAGTITTCRRASASTFIVAKSNVHCCSFKNDVAPSSPAPIPARTACWSG